MILVRRMAASLLFVGVAAFSLVAGAAPAEAGTVEDEDRLFQLHNQERTSRGMAPLAYDPAATSVARSWAQELARSADLRHNPSLAAAVDAYVTTKWTRIGENVGYSQTVDAVHTAYMNSAGHRANILGDFNRAGVGAARGADGRLWTTVVFIKGPALGSDVAASNSILRLYRAYFLRDADSAGHDYWLARLRNGELSLADISGSFAGSSEFRTRYGSLDIPRFVRLIYLNVLAREPDPSGYTYWANRLSAGTSRGSMMIGFSESPEFRTRTGLA